MSIRHTFILLILLPVAANLGCAAGGRMGAGTEHDRIDWPASAETTDQLWESSQTVLRRHRFRIDRVDRRAGIITTMPVTSQSVFEFWRHDVDTWPDLWEATLNPIRRRAEITFDLREDGTTGDLRVTVHKERLSTLDRQFNRSGEAYQFFGDHLPATTGQPKVTAADDRWHSVGRDPAMEDYLLRGILAAAR